MQYSKARIYSPTLGRFMQTDPIGYGDGLNWYNYSHSDPVNGRDPSGLECRGATGCTDAETVKEIVITAVRQTIASFTPAQLARVRMESLLNALNFYNTRPSTGASNGRNTNTINTIKKPQNGPCPGPVAGSKPVGDRSSPTGEINNWQRGIPAGARSVTAPDGTQFYAPANADFRGASRAAAGRNAITGAIPIYNAVGHWGTYDFQREGNTFIGAYTDASNYAVGVVLGGAGFTLEETFAIGGMFSMSMSSNAGSAQQRAFWKQGWLAAVNGGCK